ncbi:MAG: RNA methyltransferase [Bacteroidota bacterium]
MHKQISSLQNSLVKQILTLTEKSRERKKTGLFVIEGQREVLLALKGGYELTTVLFCPKIASEMELSEIQNAMNASAEWTEVSSEVYQKLAYRSTTEGVLAIAKAKSLALSELNLPKENTLVLVAEAPEKPGNIGALLRTADAAQLDAVIIANPKTDLYNPNILRSSVGGVFTNQLAVGSTDEVIAFLKEKRIPIYSATLQAAINYHSCDFTKNSALVVGTEATGLSQPWRDQSAQNIIIPMQGEIDSMNVSVAAGILIFEAKRQRDFS